MVTRGGVLKGVAATLHVRAETLAVETRERIELRDITDEVAAAVRRSGVTSGLVLVHSLHTTLALFLNEYQAALLDDIQRFLEAIVARDSYWKHNDPQFSDCDRANADAHLRAMLLGHSLTLPVEHGALVLGTYQRILLAELDGPRTRTLHLHVLGTA